MGSNEYKKETRIWRKEHHICVKCGKNDAEEGRTVCTVCKMDIREYQRTHKRGAESIQRHKEYSKKRREENRKNGICVVCGTRKAKEGYSSCERCLYKHRERSAKKRREQGIPSRDLMGKDGTCYFCGKPVNEHEKTCDHCYERCKNQMLYARSKKKGPNYFEKQNALFWLEKRCKNHGKSVSYTNGTSTCLPRGGPGEG